MTPEERKRSISYYQSRGMMADEATGKMTNSEVTAIFQEEISKDSITIAAQLATGKYDALNQAVERAFTRTCTTGAKMQVTNMFKEYWYVIAGVVAVIAYLLFRKKR